MEITEVRIKLIARNDDRLRAFCSITLDNDFVVRDLKIIDGSKGPFVAMPSRKLMERCEACGGKNEPHARYCSECGALRRLPPEPAPVDNRHKLHADIAHPINSRFRGVLQERVLSEYFLELERAREPGYRPIELDAQVGAEEREGEWPHDGRRRGPREDALSGEGRGRWLAGGGSREPRPDGPQEAPRYSVRSRASGDGLGGGLQWAPSERSRLCAEELSREESRPQREALRPARPPEKAARSEGPAEEEDGFGVGLYS